MWMINRWVFVFDLLFINLHWGRKWPRLGVDDFVTPNRSPHSCAPIIKYTFSVTIEGEYGDGIVAVAICNFVFRCRRASSRCLPIILESFFSIYCAWSAKIDRISHVICKF